VSEHSANVRNAYERSTRQKRALASALERSDSFCSAQDIYLDLRSRGERVGLTTVYNQLRALVDLGEVDVLKNNEGESLYRQCSSDGHHHHLLCRSCGKTVELEADEVEKWAESVAKRFGFRDISHTVEVVGLCQSCR
jgi:Fur family ferric uptake transcriptional regulator